MTIVRPETILRCHKKLIAQKFDSLKVKRKVGRPKFDVNVEQLVLEFSGENNPWGYDRIAGAIKNIGYDVSGTTVANIMRRNGLNPSGERLKADMAWSEFMRIHQNVVWATDFFTAEIWTPFGLVTYYVREKGGDKAPLWILYLLAERTYDFAKVFDSTGYVKECRVCASGGYQKKVVEHKAI